MGRMIQSNMRGLYSLFLAAMVCAGVGYGATYGGGSGTGADPYRINTAGDWQLLMNTSSDWTKSFLLTADLDLNNITVKPIGNNYTPFSGVLDGNGHILRNVTIQSSSYEAVGLFGTLSGQISRMGLIDITITGRSVVGGIVGSNLLGTISECFVTGIVNGSGTIGLFAGGSTGTIRNCYARGDITGTSYIGGFIGTMAKGAVEYCYVVNSLSSPRSMGGFAGGFQTGAITGCFWDTTTSGIQTSAGGGGLPTSDLQLLDTFSFNGWGGTVWVLDEGSDYPRLAWEGTAGSPIGTPLIPLEGDGTEANPYAIASIADLRLLNKGAVMMRFFYVLTNDLDFTGEPFQPIGYSSGGTFTGGFNGNGHTIGNLNIQLSSSDSIGLFRAIGTGGIVRQLRLDAVNIAGRDTVGAIAGSNQGTIRDCIINGIMSGRDYVGGAVGKQQSPGQIQNIGSSAAISARGYVGGLVGQSSGGTIVRSCSTGSVYGSGGTVGGIVGKNSYTTIDNCYVRGSLNAYTLAGGIVGDHQSGNISRCYSTGTIYDSSGIYGSKGRAIVGSYVAGVISNCFWDLTVTGIEPGITGLGLTTEEMLNKDTYIYNGWNGADWTQAEGQYPRLAWEQAGGDPLPAPTIPFVGTGTAADPYRVESAEALSYLGKGSIFWDKSFRLMQDVDMAGYVLRPAGYNVDNAFTGRFDGQDHAISNVTLFLPSRDTIGLFGYLGKTGELTRIRVEDCTITGNLYVGGLVGNNDGGKVNHCFVSGTIQGQYPVGGLIGLHSGILSYGAADVVVSAKTNGGGLVGYNKGTIEFGEFTGMVSGGSIGGIAGYSSGPIVGCSAMGTISGGSAGGIVGQNFSPGSISDSSSSAMIVGGDHVGGVVGRIEGGNISTSYSRGAVSGGQRVGGLAGQNRTGTITNCYATGSVTGDQYVGGLIGDGYRGKVQYCFTAGNVNGNQYVGGFMGVISYDDIQRSFWDIETTGLSFSCSGSDTETNGSVGLPTDLMHYVMTYSWNQWDGKIWTINSGQDYPRLARERAPGQPIIAPTYPFRGAGTAGSPYLISAPLELQWLSMGPVFWGKTFSLTNDLDMKDMFLCRIGTCNFDSFGGSFMGNGHVIRNIRIDLPGSAGVGLFGRAYAGSITDLGLQDVDIRGYDEVGGLTGSSTDAIRNCWVTGVVSGHDYVGGLAGRVPGAISNCFTKCTVNGHNTVGGLVGNTHGVYGNPSVGAISGCYSYSKVVGNNGVGGLAGTHSMDGTITNCFASGVILGTLQVGGLIGFNSGLVTDCYSTGSVAGTDTAIGGLLGLNYKQVRNCYSATRVSGPNGTGGLVGLNEFDGVVTSSFWDKEVSGIETEGQGTGLVTGEMMDPAAFLGANWDFNAGNGTPAVWIMLRPGEDYPRLTWQEINPVDIAGLYGVGIEDFSEIANCWLQPSSGECAAADLNHDGNVTLYDLHILLDSWLWRK